MAIIPQSKAGCKAPSTGEKMPCIPSSQDFSMIYGALQSSPFTSVSLGESNVFPMFFLPHRID